MSKVFYPPTYKAGYEAIDLPRLFQFYASAANYGMSVLKYSDTDYRIVETPTQDELDETVTYYLGGRRYVVSNAEANRLSDAGYDAYIEAANPQDEYPDGYGDEYGVDEDTTLAQQRRTFPWTELNAPPPDWYTKPTAYTGDGSTSTPTDTGGSGDTGSLGGYGAGGYGGGGYGS